METPDSLPDNYSRDYQEYVQKRVLESPLTLQDNKFFPEYSGVMEFDPKTMERKGNIVFWK